MVQPTAPEARSRRRFLKAVGATALAAGTGPAIIIPGRTQPKTLKILKHRAFSAPWGQWFKAFAEHWGQQNDTQVVIDDVGYLELDKYASTEASTEQGHDLIRLAHPPALFEEQLIDLREVFVECERRYGKPHDYVLKNTYNPKTQKFYCFPATFIVHVLLYRKDLWDTVGIVPDSWENIRLGGRQIKFFQNIPVGISLGGDGDSNNTLRAILYSFGASVQNADGLPSLHSQATLESIRFVKTLYTEAMPQDAVSWDLFSNNRAMLAGESSLTMNQSGSILGTAESKQMPIAEQILLGPAPQGPVDRLAPWESPESFAIWKFAKNISGAKQFLIDLTANAREEFLILDLKAFPHYPGTVPDLVDLVSHNAKSNPPDKYKVLATAKDWSTNYGHPGYYNVVIQEIRASTLIPAMFANAATGKMTPEEAMTQADQEVRKIFDKWRALGKV